MDANKPLLCFSGTLLANSSVRESSELQLRHLSRQPGFLGACLDIMAASEVPQDIRKAAAVYFKNRVLRHWNTRGDSIDEGEKPVIKDRLVPVLSTVDHQTRHQLIPVLRVLVGSDYDGKWPALIVQTGELLQQLDNTLALYTGVLCFSEIARYYRWVTNNERLTELDPLITQVFPHLLNVGNAILTSEITELTAEMLKLILKSYKFVTYYDLPTVLQSQEALVAWGQFHCNVTKMVPPAYVVADSMLELDRTQTQIAKCYKWSVANIERLFRRYALRDLSAKFKYDTFRSVFVSEFVPHLMSVYLSLIENWCSGTRWLGSTTLYHLLEFLSHCVTQKETWAIFQPYAENIVSHLIYPLMIPSEESLELFDIDPADYINLKMDNFDELEPDIAALGLLVTLASKRKKTTLEPIVTFAYTQLSSLLQVPEDLEVARKRDGAMRLIGGVSHLLISEKSPYYSQMEKFLSELVLPNFTSQHEFLVARTLDVCSKFSDLSFENQDTLSTLYQGILLPFTSDSSSCLPILLQGALAIQAYMHHSQFKQVLSNIIVPTMSKLLLLSGEIDNDAVSIVMQECVENFSEQLQPFGVELMKNLVEQFMKLAQGLTEAANVEIDDFDGDFVDNGDKVMAALGLLNTMITVLLSFENSRDVCIKLEETFSPAIEIVLQNDLDDLLTDVAELIENSIFLLRSVTPLMWSHFTKLSDSFSNGIALMYTEELSQCLRNYMVFGTEDLASTPELNIRFMKIISLVIEGEDGSVDYNDIVLACELAQTLILSLQQNAPPYIAELSKTILPVLASNQVDAQHVRNNSLTVALVNYVGSCLIYDCPNTVRLLEENNHLDSFIAQWYALIPQLERVYDIKLSILTLISFLSHGDILEKLPTLASGIGSKLSKLFHQLPKAIRKFEKQRIEFNEADYLNFELPNSALTEDYDDDDDDDHSAPDTANYQSFLEKEDTRLSSFGFSEETEPVFEDPLASTPLDSVDPFNIFKDFSTSLRTSNPAIYSLVFDHLNETERQVFVDVFETS